MPKNDFETAKTATEAASAMSGAAPPTPVAVAPTETVPSSAKVTWLGDPADPADINEWGGITFEKGKAVTVSDPRMIAKARANRFFKVA